MMPTTEQERRDFISGYRGMISAILLLLQAGQLGQAEALQRMRHCRERIEALEEARQ